MVESALKCKVYTDRFRTDSKKGVVGLHGFNNIYHGNLAYIDAKQSIGGQADVYYRSASDIVRCLEDFNISNYSWSEIEEIFDDIVEEKIGTISLLLNENQQYNQLENLLKNKLNEDIGNEIDFEFFRLKS